MARCRYHASTPTASQPGASPPTSRREAGKISRPFRKALAEPAALALWGGVGAVRLIEHDAASCSLLLERLDAGRPLQNMRFPEAAHIWGGLVRELSIAPDARPGWDTFERIDSTAEQWSDELPERWDRLGRPFPRWLLEAALEVCQTRGAAGRRGGLDVLVHTELHGMNILAMDTAAAHGRIERDRTERDRTERDRAVSFRAIDPQAMVGEAEFAVAPMLWNRLPELAGHDAPSALLGRCEGLAAAAGLDPEASRAWSVAREVENALWYAEHPGHRGDVERSLWVASALWGRLLPGLPAVQDLKRLD